MCACVLFDGDLKSMTREVFTKKTDKLIRIFPKMAGLFDQKLR